MRVLMCVIALSTTAALVAAQDPAQPKVVRPVQPVQPLPAQPIQPRPLPVTAVRMTQLEEEFETVEAARDVKKAHIRAAEVGVAQAATAFERVKALANTKTGALASSADVDTAKFGVEMAKAQLEIRMAELKEIEVKVKFAKKRLDEAKLNGVRPAPGVRPVPVDPAPDRAAPARDLQPERPSRDDKAKELTELKAKLEVVKAEAARAEAVAKKAEVVAKEAKAELDRILDIAMRGRVAPGTIEKAKDKAAAAQAEVDAAAKKLKVLKDEAVALTQQIEKFEK